MIGFKSRLLAAAVAATALCAGAAQAKTLVEVGIAGSDDHVYFWYSDGGGQVSSGTTGDPTAYRDYYNFPGSAWGKLVGVDITTDDRVYYWWEQTDTGIVIVTAGTTSDPDAHGVDYGFQEKANHSIITVGISKTTGHCYFYWRNKTTGAVTVTKGIATHPEAYNQLGPLQAATTLVTHDLLDVAIAGDDHVYYWWRNKATGVITVTAGTSVDPFAYRPNHYVSGL